jgi:hypothetical protein
MFAKQTIETHLLLVKNNPSGDFLDCGTIHLYTLKTQILKIYVKY